MDEHKSYRPRPANPSRMGQNPRNSETWYSNGQIAEEATFDELGLQSSYKSWNEDGSERQSWNIWGRWSIKKFEFLYFGIPPPNFRKLTWKNNLCLLSLLKYINIIFLYKNIIGHTAMKNFETLADFFCSKLRRNL